MARNEWRQEVRLRVARDEKLRQNEWSELERLAQQRETEASREKQEREAEWKRWRQEARLRAARDEELRQRLTETLNRLVKQWTTPILQRLHVLARVQWSEWTEGWDEGSGPYPSDPSAIDPYVSYVWRVFRDLGKPERVESFTVKLKVWAESGSIQSGFTVNDWQQVMPMTEDALKRALLQARRQGPSTLEMTSGSKSEPGGVP